MPSPRPFLPSFFINGWAGFCTTGKSLDAMKAVFALKAGADGKRTSGQDTGIFGKVSIRFSADEVASLLMQAEHAFTVDDFPDFLPHKVVERFHHRVGDLSAQFRTRFDSQFHYARDVTPVPLRTRRFGLTERVVQTKRSGGGETQPRFRWRHELLVELYYPSTCINTK